MDRQQCGSLQNFEESKTEILKKRLLKSTNVAVCSIAPQNTSQHNVLLSPLRAPISSSMIMSSVHASQTSIPITHNLVTHSIAPMKINTAPYPLHLSTVHVPVQIPGSTNNINVPVQLSGPTSSVPLQITPVSLPLQVSGTTNVPVQLPAGETINVPLQLPSAGQNIQLSGPTLPSMPLLQNTSQPLSSIFHVHMGSNTKSVNVDGSIDDSSGVQVKLNNPTMTQVQVAGTPTVVQIPNSSYDPIQLTAIPSSVNSGTVQLRGATRSVPHVVYIQTPTGLKPVTSTDVISQASTSGNPPQIIVRRPVTSNANIHLISNCGTKPNIAPKLTNQKSSLITTNSNQPIVIQKAKTSDKMVVPVSIAPSPQGKQAIAYLSSVKKSTNKGISENQSILISNNQQHVNANNQKLFLAPMNIPKIQNTKFILPVTLPATMASKGPIINLQIANGQIQNDPQGNITVMRDTAPMESTDLPPLQPFGKVNGKENGTAVQNPQSEKFTLSIPGSRAEPTGEQGEYTLSIPETNASMNDDIYTVSIANEEGGLTREKSFTLAIPEKGKSLLNKNMIERNDVASVTIAAPAILRRSNSDNTDRKNSIANNIKRRISLNENLSSKNCKINFSQTQQLPERQDDDADNNDDHRVPSLFCDEQLDKDLEAKVHLGESDFEDYKDSHPQTNPKKINDVLFYQKTEYNKNDSQSNFKKRESGEHALEEDPPGLIWSNGTAKLNGSVLQFQTNEFGLIDLIDNSDHEDCLINSTSKYHMPLKQRIERTNRDKKPTSPEDLYSCDGCGCHGMAAEFITPNFCSLTCQSDYQKLAMKKKDKEKSETAKKRNKIKKLLMRKHLSDTDLLQDTKESSLKHHNSMPNEAPEGSLKANEEVVDNEKYPWMCGKNGFSWMRYLETCKAKAAPVKLFKDPFPYYNRNGFKVGMRMEAIDPEHPSLFCVVSVAEVQGYRMRLHFDEYPELYDYWVNADCADVFPAGWCERNNRVLQPPASLSPAGFSWPLYLKQVSAIAAPRHLFPHVTTTVIKANSFRIGMKLEAEDRKNEMVCVATIVDMIDNRVLINFDSWDEMYDFWADATCPHVHPVGWADENGATLTPPNFYKDRETFSWNNYLSETGSTAAPPRAFKPRSPQGFKTGMKLELVDKRVPFLIRVATISAVKEHQVRVSFDGWPDELSYWLDDDSPDLHPVGWCLKTGHPLEPPLTVEEQRVAGPCGVGGCRGLGSARGGAHKQHAARAACPYATPRSDRPDRPDRLHPNQPHHHPRKVYGRPLKNNTSPPAADAHAPREKLPRGRPPKHKRVELVNKSDAVSDEESLHSGSGSKRWRGSSGRGAEEAPRTALPPPPPPRAPLDALTAALHLPHDPTAWTQEDVSRMVSAVGGAAAGSAAMGARLAGTELVMASCAELASALRLRLGPAVKLHAAVRHLRARIAPTALQTNNTMGVFASL